MGYWKMKEKPCCAAEAVRKIKPITIDGNDVGVAYLDQIINEVKAMGLHQESDIRTALLKRAMIYNYVPPRAMHAYENVLLTEYQKD